MSPNGLHAALVLSKKPYARIRSIDDSDAKLVPGFEGFFTAKDVPGGNDIGPVINDEELFASEFVTCVGQVGFFLLFVSEHPFCCLFGLKNLINSMMIFKIPLSGK